ncbi:hypothetical protein TcCL_Unassigned05575 [Trypanosoma cruzi]|uniref:Uncharacterized protein n=1 Tax=Trypanosoma cruzi (strain CL Brener) TaxID=353153 RepID=Q4DI35_TRYCC|nr:hypothetical protein Tc00.1047053507653.30 [Trypanosoma cruzi]EAN92188.1 hypothetical protein Tc00.1047053507653.30 [Trypanosoma cruzi]RNC31877.1 hypothetical protein TcCL_Unassigned05575 [Trypanosoma cruzi]|eukprot:XP_814039.1 hypothetical protein [Trypanosoma cruzi strain CL Brener]
MDEDRTASLFPLIILSVHSSHRPHVPHGSGGTTIRTAASQSDCAVDVDPFSPCLRTAAVLLHSSFSSCVCRARMSSLFLVLCRLIGHTSDASGHVCFCRDPVTWDGGCVGLRGRCEGDGATELIASARFPVGVCTVVVIVYYRMPRRATVFGYCGCFLLFPF